MAGVARLVCSVVLCCAVIRIIAACSGLFSMGEETLPVGAVSARPRSGRDSSMFGRYTTIEATYLVANPCMTLSGDNCFATWC
ncbi:hypothetical protein V8C42DRAFT_327343 [Trichoderma barbatum]